MTTATDATGNPSEVSSPPYGAQVETIVVNSAGDRPDNNPDDHVCWTGYQTPEVKPECTLGAAIETVNGGQWSMIGFDIPGSGDPHLAPANPLPEILNSVVINGTTASVTFQVGSIVYLPLVMKEAQP